MTNREYIGASDKKTRKKVQDPGFRPRMGELLMLRIVEQPAETHQTSIVDGGSVSIMACP